MEHLLFNSVGGCRFRVVYASEIDQWARQTYEANFGVGELHRQPDITITAAESIPEHDLLTGAHYAWCVCICSGDWCAHCAQCVYMEWGGRE